MPLTTYRLVTVSSTSPTLILSRRSDRVGFLIVNRNATGDTLWIGKDAGSVQSLDFANSQSIKLYVNEWVECSKKDGDDCTQELWGIGFSICNINVIESFE